jgi:hypothetical protein
MDLHYGARPPRRRPMSWRCIRGHREAEQVPLCRVHRAAARARDASERIDQAARYVQRWKTSNGDQASGLRSTNSRDETCGRHRSLRRAVYGVRSAVTSRAWRTTPLVPAARRQEASKFGQACAEQSRPMGRMSRRSALARGRGTLASTCGANPGRRVRAAATNAATAIAESALIMTVPCLLVIPGPSGPAVLLAALVTIPGFGTPSPKAESGFIPKPFCFIRTAHDETEPVSAAPNDA